VVFARKINGQRTIVNRQVRAGHSLAIGR
jgi:hypothetical protein